MSIGFGIGLRRVLPPGYEKDPHSRFTLDELVFQLIEAVAAREDHEVRDLYDEDTLMISQRDADPTSGVFMASPGVGGPLPADEARPILEAIAKVGRQGSLPRSFADYAPSWDASILVPGLPVTTARPVWSSLRYGKLPFDVGHPLHGLKVGGLEEHLAALLEWRDSLRTSIDWQEDPGTPQALVEYEKLVPALEMCRKHRLIFVWG